MTILSVDRFKRDRCTTRAHRTTRINPIDLMTCLKFVDVALKIRATSTNLVAM
jgi:hypothetical protein